MFERADGKKVFLDPDRHMLLAREILGGEAGGPDKAPKIRDQLCSVSLFGSGRCTAHQYKAFHDDMLLRPRQQVIRLELVGMDLKLASKHFAMYRLKVLRIQDCTGEVAFLT